MSQPLPKDSVLADARDEAMSEPGPAATPGELVTALPVLARLSWFAFGALVATAVTLVAMLRPWHRPTTSDHPLPYETFPFADNAGVCQEWVALATLQTSHQDAVETVRRLSALLPPTLRTENLRVVRAFAAGDRWTVAVDAQSGAGDADGAGRTATAMNALPGLGTHFEPVFYASRRLYDSAGVLCMPRQNVSSPAPR